MEWNIKQFNKKQIRNNNVSFIKCSILRYVLKENSYINAFFVSEINRPYTSHKKLTFITSFCFKFKTKQKIVSVLFHFFF